MTTRLKSLTLKACRSFDKETTVNFPERGLVLLRGKNADTGGSSGSGKSSLLLALAHAFGYCPFPATTLQSWLTEDPLEVAVTFSTTEGEAVLRRGARTSMHVDGKSIKGSVKLVEETLERLVKLPSELLEVLTYRAQDTGSHFLEMSDAEKKEFLSRVLGLDRFEKAADEALERAKKLDVDVKAKSAIADQLASLLAEQETRLAQPALVDTTQMEKELLAESRNLQAATRLLEQRAELLAGLQRAALKLSADVTAEFQVEAKALSESLDALNQQRPPPADETALSRLLAMQKQCQSRLLAARAADGQRRAVHAQQVRDLERRRADAEAFIRSESDLRLKVGMAERHAEALQAQSCPTCERPWLHDGALLANAQQQLVDLKTKLEKLAETKIAAHQLDMELMEVTAFEPDPTCAALEQAERQVSENILIERQRLQAQGTMFMVAQQKDISAVHTAMFALKERVQTTIRARSEEALSAIAEQQAEVQAAQALEQAQRTRAADAEQRLQLALATNRHQQDTYEASLRAIEEATKRVREATAAREGIAVEQRAEVDFASLVGREGFLGAIFDEALAEIASEANAVLAAVPNTSVVSLRFRTESSTQKGVTKRSIAPVIAIAGHEAPMAAGLSGGMATAVRLAVDLAITTVVSRRTGAVPGWLILDEAFNGLGLVEKEACMEILQRVASDRLVLVVDHDSTFTEMFAETIDVECNNGRSVVRQ